MFFLDHSSFHLPVSAREVHSAEAATDDAKAQSPPHTSTKVAKRSFLAIQRFFTITYRRVPARCINSKTRSKTFLYIEPGFVECVPGLPSHQLARMSKKSTT
jgi:hypothetical protein